MPAAAAAAPAGRLAYIEVRVGNTEPTGDATTMSGNALCTYVSGSLPAGAQELTCDTPLQGRFITIQIMSSNPQSILTVCEVVSLC